MDDKTTHIALKKLREEISTNKAALKLSLDNPLKASILLDGLFNLVDPNERIIRIGNKLKELGKKEMEYELLIEKERVKKVVNEYEELHPPIYESCPLCLEDINYNSSADACSYFSCCGNWICKPCADTHVYTRKVTLCLLCREPVPEEGDTELYNKRLIKCVERGIKWAQFQIGDKYESGELLGRVDMKKAFEHYKLSAEQGHPPALLYLARLYKEGVPGVVKRSSAKANTHLKQAADLGDSSAMINFGAGNWRGDEIQTAVKYATLAHHYATGKTVNNANLLLGDIFQKAEPQDENYGFGPSNNLATHYLGFVVKSDPTAFNGVAASQYSRALMEQAEDLYGMHMSGLNVIPRSVYWMRKSLAAGNLDAKGVISRMESMETGKCSACGMTEEESDKKFLRCGRCKIYWYCSKKCQLASWEAGHKVDCKSTFC